MSKMIFVTTELHPETPGGAGVVVDTLARRLSADRDCLVALLTPKPVATAERHGVSVVQIEIPEQGFLKRSEVTARAVADLAEPGDRVEFHDFEGIGYLTLAHRIDLGLDQTVVTVRFHGPYDLLAGAMVTPSADWDIPSAMEQEVFKMCDTVLIPVEAHRTTLVERYGLDDARIRLAPPEVPTIGRSSRSAGTKPVFAVVGRLGEMKGSQDMVDAALALLDQGHDFETRFIGADGWSTTNSSSMRQWLESRIDERRRPAFTFVDQVDRAELPDLTADVTAVVVPSRFESFCLAAHEARMMGHPVVVPDLAAFKDLFEQATGALVYDGSVDGLSRALGRIIGEPGLADLLASAPLPDVGDPMEAYRNDPEPRHPRAQAGLATAATQRVNELWKSATERVRPSLLQEVYRMIPDRVARVLRLAPQGLKDRVKARASWPVEAARRQRENRLAEVERRIGAGDFVDLDDPDVTVVIPVHDDVNFLEETLASVYEQTHPSWEIVVVDDGSTDPDAIAVLDRLERPRLRLIRQPNTGLPGARNAGITVARARFVVPLDSDDELDPEFMTQMIAALEAFPQAAYAHCYARLHHDVDALWITRPFNPYWQLIGNGVLGCVLLRKEAWEAVGGYDETMIRGNEDWELWLRLMKHRWGQVQVPQVLFRYRKHGISMSVATEARFEEGRRLVRDRHGELYDPERLRRFKKRWYPLVTVVADQVEAEHAEIEVVDSVEGLTGTWGKYVTDVRGIEPMPLELVMSMATALESNPKAARAVTGGLPPVVMVRRWNLHDPGATPNGVVVVDDPTVGREVEMPNHLPRPGWSVPDGMVPPGVTVQRQPPEEAGTMPDPNRW